MPTKERRIVACDCETDPFEHGRLPRPFMWGVYDGQVYKAFFSTAEFVETVRNKNIILYAHNGGKFDFMYLLEFIGETKAQIINGRIVSMFLGQAELRDSFSAVPESLKSAAGKLEIDIWKLEENCRGQHMEEIIEYNRMDCVFLYRLMERYRSIAGKRKTIASNALAFAKKQGIKTGKTSYAFDRKYRPFFYGGRCECFSGGTHRNFRILDIKSAYPFAMLHDHATGADFEWRDTLDGMSTEQIQRAFMVVECQSAGAFPKRIERGPDAGLHFPHEYDEYNVTGWEYLAALEHGLISNVTIHSVRHSPNTINFRPYVEHWYKYKQDHSAKDESGERINKIDYTIGKILLNSLYGKMAQDATRYFDYKIVPAGTSICYDPVIDPKTELCQCGEPEKNHGWTLYLEYDCREIHRREALWKYKFNRGVEWEGQKLFHNVATGASITGFTRAYLLRAMASVGMEHIIYCDTDSIFVTSDGDISNLPIGPNLGDWEIEEHNAPIGYFAGKKLYGVKTSHGKEKIASKGSRLVFEDIQKIIAGEVVTYRQKAPSFHIDGSHDFPVRSIRSTVPIKSGT